jgi:hypothetical protein
MDRVSSKLRYHGASGIISAVVAVVLGLAVQLSAQAPDAAEDIRGPKPLVEIPQPQKPDIARWLGITGAAALLVMGAWLWSKHANKQRHKSPQEIALVALAILEASRETLAAEAFADRAAQTIRQYIAERFGIAAPRRTSEEFLHDLANDTSSRLSDESDHLRTFLKVCDLAKFAASPLDGKQRGELLGAARGFITATAAPDPNSKLKVVTP